MLPLVTVVGMTWRRSDTSFSVIRMFRGHNRVFALSPRLARSEGWRLHISATHCFESGGTAFFPLASIPLGYISRLQISAKLSSSSSCLYKFLVMRRFLLLKLFVHIRRVTLCGIFLFLFVLISSGSSSSSSKIRSRYLLSSSSSTAQSYLFMLFFSTIINHSNILVARDIRRMFFYLLFQFYLLLGTAHDGPSWGLVLLYRSLRILRLLLLLLLLL